MTRSKMFTIDKAKAEEVDNYAYQMAMRTSKDLQNKIQYICKVEDVSFSKLMRNAMRDVIADYEAVKGSIKV